MAVTLDLVCSSSYLLAEWGQVMSRDSRVILSGGAGLFAFLATMPGGCDDVPGPAWERCSSMIGVPSPTDWSWMPGLLVPLYALAVGVGVSLLIWWLLAKVSGPEKPPDDREP